ncbi:MAG: hypothetical protein HOP15_09780 [Planctomycetes bacterium]|nr:hypothetical protein [Planctomycetota bacterium]
MKDEKKPNEAEPAKSPAPPEKATENGAEAARKKPAYVFKIVPADPKNAFDFEDVADK